MCANFFTKYKIKNKRIENKILQERKKNILLHSRLGGVLVLNNKL